MNRFVEAKRLVEINKKLEYKAFDESVGYSPGDNDLSPNEYFSEGYLNGQQELICHLIDNHIISVNDVKHIWE